MTLIKLLIVNNASIPSNKIYYIFKTDNNSYEYLLIKVNSIMIINLD